MRYGLLIIYFIFSFPNTTELKLGQLRRQGPLSGYHLIWHDEFNGKILDRSKWMYRGLGKRGDAYNVESAVRLNKGCLVITTGVSGDSLTTGMVATEGLFETRYGYFEARVSLTNTNGIWPAFWLQSSLNGDNGTPEKNGVEIDIFEYFRNNRPDAVSHSLHWGGYGRTHHEFGPFYSNLMPKKDGFHVFGLEWTPDYYSTFVDGVKTYTGTTYISRVPQFMILSVEANQAIAGKVEKNKLPDQFLVDYIRVYQKY